MFEILFCPCRHFPAAKFFSGKYLHGVGSKIYNRLEKFLGGIDMDITRRKFLTLAGAAGLMLSFGKVSAANEKILVP